MRILVVIALTFPLLSRAVIVDRVAIAVGDKVIIDSEIDLRIRLTAFQNRATADFSPESRRQAAQKLIDQKLIEREMDVGRYPRLDVVQRKALLADFRKSDGGADPAKYGLTPQDVEDDLARQSDLLTFLNLRFRPAVQVTDQDAERYYAAHTPKGVSFNEMRAEIDEKLTQERADKELDLWLADQHKRTKIIYLEKELEANNQPDGQTK